MSTELHDNELTDIALCYQSMGVPLDASPVEIEQRFHGLVEEYKKKLISPDLGAREDAKRNLELVTEMYDKIRSSITYHAMEKDHLKKSGEAAASEKRATRPVHRAIVDNKGTVLCHRCNGTIPKGLKTCPICKTHIFTASEQLFKTIFTPAKVITFCLILAVVASLFVFRSLRADKAKDGMTDIESFDQKNVLK